jgi:hypothetical protein
MRGHFFIWVAILSGTGIATYFIGIFIMAMIEAKAAPREPMVWCPVHGAIRQQHMIKFLDSDFCPSCFHERMKKAEKSGG